MTPAIEQTFSTNEVAKLCGVSLRKLQYWDEVGVVRTHIDGHSRRWSARDVRRVQLIRDMRSKGIWLADIAKFLKRALAVDLPGTLLIQGEWTGGDRTHSRHWKPTKARYCPDEQSVITLAAKLPGPVIVIEIPKEQHA